MGKVFNRDVEITGGWVLKVNDVTVVDASWNIDAPVTTTNLTTSGNTTLGSDSSDTLTVPSTSQINAPMTVGASDTGYDVKLWWATAGKYRLWDESADSMILVWASDQTGNAQLTGTLTVWVDGTWHDVQLFWDTAWAHLLWDQSEDAITLVGGAKMDIGLTGTPLVLTEGVPIVEMFSTCASTDTGVSAEPFYLKSTMTGAGWVGWRSRFHMYTNVALGWWSNALKAYAEYGATGSTTWLWSAFCGELTLSAGTSSGTYAPLESELVLGSWASTGTETSFIYMAASGADVATMDTSGDLFKLDWLTAASGKLFQANTAAAATHALRIDIGWTKYYVMLTDTGA